MYTFQIGFVAGLLTGCNFITAEELAFRQGAGSGCSDVWFLDADGDGVGGSVSLFACESPGTEYTQLTGDCNDENPMISPLSTEDCSTTVDEDCNGSLNAADPADMPPSDCINWFADRDLDGFGDDNDVQCNCIAEDVYTVLEGGDCYDQLATVNPEQPEVCGDGFDNNCDGSANGCGYSSDFLLTDSQLITGEASQIYAGSSVSTGLLLPDDAPAALFLSSGAVEGNGRIDVFDAETLNTATGTVLVTEGIVSISGEQDSDFGERIFAKSNLIGNGAADLVVSAPLWSTDEGNSYGKVYVFEGPLRGNVSAQNAALQVVGGEVGARFGSSLSVVEEQLWVGAQGSDFGAVNAGSVFVYDPEGLPIHQITPTEPSMRFGSAMTRSEDFNGDGVPDIAVGASGANDGKGAVFVFWSAGDLSAFAPSDADVVWNGVVVDGSAGAQVAAVGDVTGDGVQNLAVTAPNSSRAYVVSASESTVQLLDQAPVTILGDADSALGSSVTEMGDFNGDGQSDLVLGGFIGSQIAILYGPLNGTYTSDNIVLLQNRGSDQLGWSIAGGIDFTGDEVSDLFVGARTASEGFNKNGIVFMLEGLGL